MKNRVYASLCIVCLCINSAMYPVSANSEMLEKTEPLIEHWKGKGSKSQIDAGIEAYDIGKYFGDQARALDNSSDALRIGLETAYRGLNTHENRLRLIEHRLSKIDEELGIDSTATD